jgi:predicted nucleic acid-binding protein
MSRTVERWIRRLRQPVVSDLAELEVVSAIARKVRGRAMLRPDGRKVTGLFLAHLDAGYYTRVPVERQHYRLARDWIGGFEVPLRTLDALHLAICALTGLPLATADRTLARHARAIGARVVRVP